MAVEGLKVQFLAVAIFKAWHINSSLNFSEEFGISQKDHN